MSRSIEIPGLIFWPEKKIRHTFQEADAAMGTPGETAALWVFHRRMQFFFQTSDGIDFTDPESGVLVTAHYERPRLAADIDLLRRPVRYCHNPRCPVARWFCRSPVNCRDFKP
jgi:hypothetical protein